MWSSWRVHSVIVMCWRRLSFRQPARWRQSRDDAKNDTTLVVETLVTINNSPIQDYIHLAGRSPTYHITPGLKPFSVIPTSLFNRKYFSCPFADSVQVYRSQWKIVIIPLASARMFRTAWQFPNMIFQLPVSRAKRWGYVTERPWANQKGRVPQIIFFSASKNNWTYPSLLAI